jgi:hypothetical protein
METILYIPVISSKYDEAAIQEVFEYYVIGQVSRVEFFKRSARIHLVSWYNSHVSKEIYSYISSGGIYYLYPTEKKEYWIIKKNKSEKKMTLEERVGHLEQQVAKLLMYTPTSPQTSPQKTHKRFMEVFGEYVEHLEGYVV